ncbi:XdhC/CoxI family protein [bacterium]|nr:MAG: XdhC/CoxI family protein [bacterium]
MKEHQDLIREWRALPLGTPAILATVVATRGSTYRKPGARMLITEDRWLAGSISGGCLESDIVHTAWERTKDGPAIVEYDATAEDDILLGFGLGCSGATTVLMTRLPADGGVLAFLERAIADPRGGELDTIIEPGPGFGASCGRLGDESWQSVEGRFVDGRPTLHERIEGPFPLVVFGAGHDAIPLARLAADLGWRVTVIDGRTTHAIPARFPGAHAVLVAAPRVALEHVTLPPGGAAVLMTHGYTNDLTLLGWLLDSELGYIGALGPVARRERLLGDLEKEDRAPNDAQRARLHAPVGLDLGAKGPEEIALSIVAEILAWRNGRNGGSRRIEG